MLEEIWGVLNSRWGLAAVVLVAMPGSRKFLRTAAKEAIRAGIVVSEGAKDLYAEVKDEASDVIAEVKAERKQLHSEKEKAGHKHD